MKNFHNLINKALQLHEEGKIQDAISLYSKVLQNNKARQVSNSMFLLARNNELFIKKSTNGVRAGLNGILPIVLNRPY